MVRRKYTFKKLDFKFREKEPLKPLLKHQKLVTVVSILIVMVTLHTGSYTIFSQTMESEKENKGEYIHFQCYKLKSTLY